MTPRAEKGTLIYKLMMNEILCLNGVKVDTYEFMEVPSPQLDEAFLERLIGIGEAWLSSSKIVSQ